MEITRLDLQEYPKSSVSGRTPEKLRSATEDKIESYERESDKNLGGGVNTTLLVKLKDDGSVIFKPKNGENENWKELVQYKRERAAYLVDRFLDFGLVPPTVIRDIDGAVGSAQEFIPDALSGHEYEHVLQADDVNIDKYELKEKLYLFDYIIANGDRHGNNWLVKNGRVIAIDHGVSFWPWTDSPSIEFPKEWVEKIKKLIDSTETYQILCDLLSELLPQKDVEAFKKRLTLITEQNEIH